MTMLSMMACGTSPELAPEEVIKGDEGTKSKQGTAQHVLHAVST